MSRDFISENASDGQRAVLEHVPVSIIVADPFGKDLPIVYVNRAFERLTGYSREGSIGRNCRFLQGEGTEREQVDRMRAAIAGREEVTVRLTNYRANGEAFRSEVSIAPIWDDDGGLSYFVGLQREIEEDVAESDTEVMLRELQHRVKNHLSMVVSLIRMEAREAEGGGATSFDGLAHRIESLQLIYDQLNASSGHTERIDFAAYVSQLAASMTALAHAPRVRIEVRCEPCTLGVDAAARIGLIASELITNALKHAFAGRESGLVEVTLRALGNGRARLTISDDGVGLPSDGAPADGGGIGARLVEGLIRSVGADFWIDGGGQGTAFKLEFDAGPPAVAGPADRELPGREPG